MNQLADIRTNRARKRANKFERCLWLLFVDTKRGTARYRVASEDDTMREKGGSEGEKNTQRGRARGPRTAIEEARQAERDK